MLFVTIVLSREIGHTENPPSREVGGAQLETSSICFSPSWGVRKGSMDFCTVFVYFGFVLSSMVCLAMYTKGSCIRSREKLREKFPRVA